MVDKLRVVHPTKARHHGYPVYSLERVRKGLESVHSTADVRKDLGLDD